MSKKIIYVYVVTSRPKHSITRDIIVGAIGSIIGTAILAAINIFL